jgi:hypothetical protein
MSRNKRPVIKRYVVKQKEPKKTTDKHIVAALWIGGAYVLGCVILIWYHLTH